MSSIFTSAQKKFLIFQIQIYFDSFCFNKHPVASRIWLLNLFHRPYSGVSHITGARIIDFSNRFKNTTISPVAVLDSLSKIEILFLGSRISLKFKIYICITTYTIRVSPYSVYMITHINTYIIKSILIIT